MYILIKFIGGRIDILKSSLHLRDVKITKSLKLKEHQVGMAFVFLNWLGGIEDLSHWFLKDPKNKIN